MTKLLTGLAAWLGALFRARPKSSAATGTAAVLIAAAAFVGPWEGERLDAYLDRIADPPVWTVCYGETKGVQQGDRYTAQQCLDMLSASLAGYHAQFAKCVPALTAQPRTEAELQAGSVPGVGAGDTRQGVGEPGLGRRVVGEHRGGVLQGDDIPGGGRGASKSDRRLEQPSCLVATARPNGGVREVADRPELLHTLERRVRGHEDAAQLAEPLLGPVGAELGHPTCLLHAG